MAVASQQALAAIVTFKSSTESENSLAGPRRRPKTATTRPAGKIRPRISRNHQLGHSPRRRRFSRSRAAAVYTTTRSETETEPPYAAFIGVFPALGADSWITTPGMTALAGSGGTTGRQQLVVRYDQRRPADQFPVRIGSRSATPPLFGVQRSGQRVGRQRRSGSASLLFIL